MLRTAEDIVVAFGDVPEPPKDELLGIPDDGLLCLIQNYEEKAAKLDSSVPNFLPPKIRIEKYNLRLKEILNLRNQARERAKAPVEAVIGTTAVVLPVVLPVPQEPVAEKIVA